MPDGSAPIAIPPIKSHFRIGEVSALLGVEAHVIRFWEQQLPAIRTERSKTGQRVYSRRVLELLIRVRHLLYVELYTIAGAKRRLRKAETCPHCGKELGDGNE